MADALETQTVGIRARNVLKISGIRTKQDLTDFLDKHGQDGFLRFGNCGRKTVNEIVSLANWTEPAPLISLSEYEKAKAIIEAYERQNPTP